MTFKEFCNKFYTNEIINNKYVDKMVFHLSKTCFNKSDLIANANTEIDFEVNDFLFIYDQVIIKKKPIEYILKKISFLNIDYTIDTGVFIPRNETEFIVDWIIESDFVFDNANVFDLCTGSGVIANTIKFYKKSANVYGVDSSFKAIQTAKANAKMYNLGVKFFWKNVFRVDKKFYKIFDLIICNPPYIDKNFKLDDSVIKYEPKKALFAKHQGLDFYFKFILEIYPFLKNGSKTIFEIGFDQKEKLEEFLIEHKINDFYFLKDLQKNYRILVIDKNEKI